MAKALFGCDKASVVSTKNYVLIVPTPLEAEAHHPHQLHSHAHQLHHPHLLKPYIN